MYGEVAEWSKALAWRASRRLKLRLEGSNPSLSASIEKDRMNKKRGKSWQNKGSLVFLWKEIDKVNVRGEVATPHSVKNGMKYSFEKRISCS